MRTRWRTGSHMVEMVAEARRSLVRRRNEPPRSDVIILYRLLTSTVNVVDASRQLQRKHRPSFDPPHAPARAMASPAPALVINEAKWCATKGGMDITVTDVCAKLVAERGAGKYLYLHNSENKAAYVIVRIRSARTHAAAQSVWQSLAEGDEGALDSLHVPRRAQDRDLPRDARNLHRRRRGVLPECAIIARCALSRLTSPQASPTTMATLRTASPMRCSSASAPSSSSTRARPPTPPA